MAQDCIFCRMAAGEIPVASVYEDSRTLAFLDIHPCATGHTIVIPKFHAKDIVELPEDEVGPLFVSVKKVAAKICEVMGSDGMTIGINQGEAGHQGVGHLHVHLIPRKKDDGGGSIHTVISSGSEEGLAELVKKLKI